MHILRRQVRRRRPRRFVPPTRAARQTALSGALSLILGSSRATFRAGGRALGGALSVRVGGAGVVA